MSGKLDTVTRWKRYGRCGLAGGRAVDAGACGGNNDRSLGGCDVEGGGGNIDFGIGDCTVM